MVLGGAGAGGQTSAGTQTGSMTGGDGGGIVVFFAKKVVVTGAINANGGSGASEQGESSTARKVTAGSGAGGSILICSEDVTLGSSLLTAIAGVPVTPSGVEPFIGGAGAVGRIAIHYGRLISGTTNPAANEQQDNDFIQGSPSAYFLE